MRQKPLTSKQNPRYKAALKLKTSRGRKQQQRCLIVGTRELQRALSCSHIKLLELYSTANFDDSDSASRLYEQCQNLPVDWFTLPEDLFNEFQYGDRCSQFVGVIERPNVSLENLSIPEKGLVVILQGVEKPGNLGAILRSMDATAADTLLVCEPQCDVFHPNAIRSSMGCVFSIPLAVSTSEQAAQFCEQNRIQLLAATDSASTPYTKVDMSGATGIAFGSEANGLSSFWMPSGAPNASSNNSSCKIQAVSIPMRGISDSLNVSVAAAVMLFEARRQRDQTN